MGFPIVIRTYTDTLIQLVERYVKARIVLQTQLTVEQRPGEQGYIHGILLFPDRSELHFREYLTTEVNAIQRVMCSYHYQDTERQLRFRYDNARHRPLLQAQEHKHTQDHIIECPAPTLEEVMIEIVMLHGWLP